MIRILFLKLMIASNGVRVLFKLKSSFKIIKTKRYEANNEYNNGYEWKTGFTILSLDTFIYAYSRDAITSELRGRNVQKLA